MKRQSNCLKSCCVHVYMYKRLLPRESDFVRESRWIFSLTTSACRSTKSTCCCGRFRMIWNNQQQRRLWLFPTHFQYAIKTKKKSILSGRAERIGSCRRFLWIMSDAVCRQEQVERNVQRSNDFGFSEEAAAAAAWCKAKNPNSPDQWVRRFGASAHSQSRVACNHVLQNLSDRE